MMSPVEELSWEEYEHLTQYIYGAIGSRKGIKVLGFGRDCKAEGKSGVNYQIDVLTEEPIGDQRLLTAIECKYWKEKVTLDVVLKLSSILRDTGIANGIIVTKTGFTGEAKKYADYHGIKLVTFNQITDANANFGRDIEIGTLNIRANIIRRRPIITCIDFGSVAIADEIEILKMYFARLYDEKGDSISFGVFVSAFAEILEKRGELLKLITHKFVLKKCLSLKRDGMRIPINEISFTGYYTKTDLSSNQMFTLTDRVWMIMEELFGDRKYMLSKSGFVWQDAEV